MRNKLPVLFSMLLMLGCASPKTFRTLSKNEKEIIESYKKQVNTKDGNYHVLIMTNEGNMVVKLYNGTPLHRDNFISKVKSGFYDSLMFHRVINNFMIQGGDPTSKKAQPGQALGSGSAPGDRIPAEFRTEQGIYHKRGALAAARDQNPEKASSNCQFYIVQRPAWNLEELGKTVIQRQLTLNDEQKKIYTTIGGTPHLDGGYTVFGELDLGFEALDRIATTNKNTSDRPDVDVRMRMFVLSEPKKK
jgi:cyclophilin family peptidyl-prolyl cis-trans isomerase